MLNYTTTIDAEKSIREIQNILAKAGADAVLTEYDGDRNIKALGFKIMLDGQPISFRLPSDPAPFLEALKLQARQMQAAGKRVRFPVDEDHARRVTWRVIKDWVEAQAALIEARQATLAQVFLPYAITKDGQTLYESIAADPRLLLGGGNG